MPNQPNSPVGTTFSTSPTRRRGTLTSIPEAKTAANAFVQQAAMMERMERHRLEGNAFYQQEQMRRVTPPTAIHPALRPRNEPDTYLQHPLDGSTEPRISTVTTMSPFIDAGKRPSPPLNLVPGGQQFQEPTQRGVIEERREQMLHEASGSEDDRTPVYQTYAPTPKPGSSEFGSHDRPSEHKTPRKSRGSLPRKDAGSLPPKSPKKGLLEKLGMRRTGNVPSPSMSTLAGHEAFVIEEAGIPVKAQAVLGTSPSKAALLRSPSKKKQLFSLRKPNEINVVKTASPTTMSASMSGREPPRTSSSLTKTPQTSHTTTSDPTYYSSMTSRDLSSQAPSECGVQTPQTATKYTVQRSQSLKYFDPGAPPTPPAKNTPPHIKTAQEAAAATKLCNVSPEMTEATPSKIPCAMLSISDLLSPTKYGSCARKETAKLVTKPSTYSLHASIVPETMEAHAFEEMKARIDGLGLEGFSLPNETQYQRSPEIVYSPSIYEDNIWGIQPSTREQRPRSSKRFSMHEMPGLIEVSAEHESTTQSANHSIKKSSSSGVTIAVCYPDLAADHSPTSPARVTPGMCEQTKPYDNTSFTYIGQQANLKPALPVHGLIHSPDHSSASKQSADLNVFALPVQELQDDTNFSPASYNHPSAMPSPLHYLPATVYTPPPKRTRQDFTTPVPASKHETSSGRDSGLGITGVERRQSTSPIRNHDALINAPSWQAPKHCTSTISRSLSPGLQPAGGSETNPDPRKRVSTSSGNEKLDLILSMLSQVTTRNHENEELLEEMRATNARLEARLAVAGNLEPRLSPSPVSDWVTADSGSLAHRHEEEEKSPAPAAREGEKRISTAHAHDFYRQSGAGQATPSSPLISLVSGSSAGVEALHGIEAADVEAVHGVEALQVVEQDDKGGKGGKEHTQATIAELTASNAVLTKMVLGFAARLEEMGRGVGQ
ncbi:hypothetical protein LTR62_002805 [Meristemomyces frigidus]|uniref:Uncharacterized protein n=1 Tax=Meristemomyces frigidus TaxID=1508187 RepID=A0AAN7TI69_9PEZI|nr:hypothetical protein LTR62_002805 [Meristemomyces frigidus]